MQKINIPTNYIIPTAHCYFSLLYVQKRLMRNIRQERMTASEGWRSDIRIRMWLKYGGQDYWWTDWGGGEGDLGQLHHPILRMFGCPPTLLLPCRHLPLAQNTLLLGKRQRDSEGPMLSILKCFWHQTVIINENYVIVLCPGPWTTSSFGLMM